MHFSRPNLREVVSGSSVVGEVTLQERHIGVRWSGQGGDDAHCEHNKEFHFGWSLVLSSLKEISKQSDGVNWRWHLFYSQSVRNSRQRRFGICINW